MPYGCILNGIRRNGARFPTAPSIIGGMRRKLFALLAAASLLSGASALAATRHRSHKSPHVEIAASARVESAPRRSVHANGRTFLEFEVTLIDPRVSDAQPADADRGVSIDTAHPVQVVHDVSCGGTDLSLAPGDRIELQGEYVKIPKKGGQGGLIHFTHSASGRCGQGGGHPDGYLRKAPPPTPVASAPRPAARVPDQPYTGPPPRVDRPYAEIVRLRESGESNEALLAKVRRENVLYSLSIFEIQKLRAAGVAQNVIEAMLASGRAEPTRRAS